MAKEITWRGKSEEEVIKMDLKKFMDLVPSRARRSLKRGFTEQQQKLIKKLQNNDKSLKTHSRDMIIIPLMIGKTLKVYNGKEYFPVAVTLEMLGHTLGEFSHTRKSVAHSAAGVGATRSSKAVSAR